eukprot:4704977-Pleurochrysis_carterae.AAC.4
MRVRSYPHHALASSSRSCVSPAGQRAVATTPVATAARAVCTCPTPTTPRQSLPDLQHSPLTLQVPQPPASSFYYRRSHVRRQLTIPCSNTKAFFS